MDGVLAVFRRAGGAGEGCAAGGYEEEGGLGAVDGDERVSFVREALVGGLGGWGLGICAVVFLGKGAGRMDGGWEGVYITAVQLHGNSPQGDVSSDVFRRYEHDTRGIFVLFTSS